jgi:hypothetical protein
VIPFIGAYKPLITVLAIHPFPKKIAQLFIIIWKLRFLILFAPTTASFGEEITTLRQGRHQSLSSNGDSVFVLDLKVNPFYLNEQHIDLCSGQSFNWNGQNYFNAGAYTVYNTTAAGCDSIERLVLAVHPTSTNLLGANLCRGDSIEFGMRWLNQSGTYLDSLQSVFGCDSLVQLTLDVFPKDTTVLFWAIALIARAIAPLCAGGTAKSKAMCLGPMEKYLSLNTMATMLLS